MARKAYIIVTILGGTLLLAGICSVSSQETKKLTEQHGTELKTAYEDHVRAQVIALETGDLSILQDTTTGWELENLVQIISSGQATEVIEWSKVEIKGFKVKEYSPDLATVSLYEEYIGNIPDPSIQGRPWICQLTHIDGRWKVSRCNPPDY